MNKHECFAPTDKLYRPYHLFTIMKNVEGQDGSRIKAINTSFRIIDALHEHGPAGVTTLAKITSLPKSTLYKHLMTLVDLGYISKQDDDYAISLRWLKLGGAVRDQTRIYTHARQKMEELVDDIGEMLILSIREGNQGVFIHRAHDEYNLKQTSPLGARFNLHTNAGGKAMLAEMSDEDIDAYIKATGLPAVNDNTITNPNELWEQIQRIRERGYSLNLGERVSEVRSASSAIVDPVNGQIGAISISAPSGSPSTEHLDGEYGEAVRKITSELTLKLKHS